MTLEEARERLQCQAAEMYKATKDTDVPEEYIGREIRTLDIAIGCIKKQIPIQPIKTDTQEIRYTDSYHCPSCGGGFTGTGIADYCYHCGQKLDWECDQK